MTLPRRSIFPILLLFVLFFVYRFSFRDQFEFLELIQISLNTFGDLIVSLLIAFLLRLLPQKLRPIARKSIRYSVLMILILVSYGIGVLILQRFHYFNYTITTGLSEHLNSIFNNLAYQIFDSYLVLAFGVIFLVGFDYYQRWEIVMKEKEVVEHERIRAELSFLKAQINPHFIFNTLNNVHFMIDEENHEARKLIVNFSDLLRYQLYEIGNDLVPVENEIIYLKKYIELQRIRKEDSFKVHFEHDAPEYQLIAPMLLIIPVENAFKYASSGDLGYVNISLKLDHQNLLFTVENDLVNEVVSTPSGGLGIDNLTKRLALIYGKRASFKHYRKMNRYSSVLNINMAKNE